MGAAGRVFVAKVGAVGLVKSIAAHQGYQDSVAPGSLEEFRLHHRHRQRGQWKLERGRMNEDVVAGVVGSSSRVGMA